MKPLPAPHIPGNTEAERMDNAVRRMFSVSKEDMLREEARLKGAKGKQKDKKEAYLTTSFPLTQIALFKSPFLRSRIIADSTLIKRTHQTTHPILRIYPSGNLEPTAS